MDPAPAFAKAVPKTLSLTDITGLPVRVLESAASNQKTHPGTDRGSKPKTFFGEVATPPVAI